MNLQAPPHRPLPLQFYFTEIAYHGIMGVFYIRSDEEYSVVPANTSNSASRNPDRAPLNPLTHWNSLVQGSGFRVQGSGFRVQGSGFRV